MASDWLAWQVSKLRTRRRSRSAGGSDVCHRASTGHLVGIGLVVALVHHYQNGISPLSRRFALEPVTEHARRAEPFIERVNGLPPEVPISVGSNLYPHVAHRERVYLFPTVSDAQNILLDVTGPVEPGGCGRSGADRAGAAGLCPVWRAPRATTASCLLERDLDDYRLSPTFYDVLSMPAAIEPQVPVGADFGGLLRLEGFDWDVRPVVRPELVVEITTYWRALSALDEEYPPGLFLLG